MFDTPEMSYFRLLAELKARENLVYERKREIRDVLRKKSNELRDAEHDFRIKTDIGYAWGFEIYRQYIFICPQDTLKKIEELEQDWVDFIHSNGKGGQHPAKCRVQIEMLWSMYDKKWGIEYDPDFFEKNGV